MKIKKFADVGFQKTKRWVKICFLISILPLVGGSLLAILVCGIWAMLEGEWITGLLLEVGLLWIILMLIDMHRAYIIVETDSVLCVDYYMGFCRRRRFAYQQIDIIQKEYSPRRGDYYSFYTADGKQLFWICYSEEADRVFGKYVADKRKY